MDDAQIKEMVRTRYGGIAEAAGDASCCGPTAACFGDMAPATPAAKSREMGYSDAEPSAVPDGANLGLGCGNPQAIAALRPGEMVLDLGSGAGFDCFLAAQQVGKTGRVIGVDMTHEMLKKARENAAKIDATNVEFRLGELEHVPVADNEVDVAISNCVINLVPDKAQVFRETFRVLKPGGRIAISDVVNKTPLSAELKADIALLCGCVAGAASADQLTGWLRDAGFVDIQITPKPESREPGGHHCRRRYQRTQMACSAPVHRCPDHRRHHRRLAGPRDVRFADFTAITACSNQDAAMGSRGRSDLWTLGRDLGLPGAQGAGDGLCGRRLHYWRLLVHRVHQFRQSGCDDCLSIV